jgi:hypothetical protein
MKFDSAHLPIAESILRMPRDYLSLGEGVKDLATLPAATALHY